MDNGNIALRFEMKDDNPNDDMTEVNNHKLNCTDLSIIHED